MDEPTDKQGLRSRLIQQRRLLTVSDWQARSLQLCQQLQQSPLFAQTRTVLAYFSFRQEPDLSSLFKINQCTWGFPRCQGSELHWHRWSPEQPEGLVKGTHGTLEPQAHLPSLEAAEVDLILLPAVACDRRGYRLGYGGGFYDRLLSQPDWRSIPTVGIVFAFALLECLPVDPWDQPLEAVCTEREYFVTLNPQV